MTALMVAPVCASFLAYTRTCAAQNRVGGMQPRERLGMDTYWRATLTRYSRLALAWPAGS